jgi:hypothetical protein
MQQIQLTKYPFEFVSLVLPFEQPSEERYLLSLIIRILLLLLLLCRLLINVVGIRFLPGR